MSAVAILLLFLFFLFLANSCQMCIYFQNFSVKILKIIFSQEFRLKNQGFLKELRNRTLRTEVTVLFNTALRKYAFSTVSFEKLVFRFKTLKHVLSYYAILLCKFIV